MKQTRRSTAPKQRAKKIRRRWWPALLICLVIIAVAGFVFRHDLSSHFNTLIRPGNNSELASKRAEDMAELAEKVVTAPRYVGPWTLVKPSRQGQIEGYASQSSVAQGQAVTLQVSCSNKTTFRADVFRMGWYDGAGAKLIQVVKPTACSQQDIPSADPNTGLIEPLWPASVRLATTSQWSQGYYLVRLTRSDGYQSYVPFMIRSPSPTGSPYLFIHAVSTDAAYNDWGGNSLYAGYTSNLGINRAVKVSLNRPLTDNNGAGEFLNWEYPMVRFLERKGYPVDYANDIDINNNPALLLKYKSVIITGHDEYWSKAMYDGYEKAVAKGVNLAVFGANTLYRPTRFEDDPLTRQSNNIVVCYKDYLIDPDYYDAAYRNTGLTGYSWRSSPFVRPESELLGEMYKDEVESTGNFGLTIADSNNWMFKGTGAVNGMTFAGLVGYEFDDFNPNSPHPKGVQVIFHSDVKDLGHISMHSDATYYQLPKGGQVFDAGTISWAWGIEPTLTQYAPTIEQVTANILDRFGS